MITLSYVFVVVKKSTPGRTLTHVLATKFSFRSFHKRSTASTASDFPDSIYSSQNHFNLNSKPTLTVPK